MTDIKKDIKDYLHLYLGCECVLESEHVNKEPNIKTLRSIPFLFGQLHAEFGDNTAYEISEKIFKPILRPLSDITEEERIEIGIYYESCHCSNPGTTCKDGFHPGIIEWEPESVIKALSKGFDLFGLHEAGLCLYKEDLRCN